MGSDFGNLPLMEDLGKAYVIFFMLTLIGNSSHGRLTRGFPPSDSDTPCLGRGTVDKGQARMATLNGNGYQ